MQSRCKYGILAPEEPAGNPDTTETQEIGAGHWATRGAEAQRWTETETGNKTGQRALLARGMPVVDNGGRSIPRTAARA